MVAKDLSHKKLSPPRYEVYSITQNLVLWARSEYIGYAVNPAASGTGMMEYWIVGILGIVEWDLFYKDGTNYHIKSDHHPLLIPIFPLFHHSNIPFGN